MPSDGLDLEDLTAQVIRRAMEKFGGNQTRAAAFLGMSRMALHRRLKKMGMI
ncbi:MAG: helix-turn-helix domain-containing protein [Planctomycetota bacterium]|nr:helix-turn-helix domain-containing protein [Planctomycetota bacterium]